MTKRSAFGALPIWIAPLLTPGPLPVKATRPDREPPGRVRDGSAAGRGLPRQTRRDRNPKNDPQSCREAQKSRWS